MPELLAALASLTVARGLSSLCNAGLSFPEACGVFPRPGIEPVTSALAGIVNCRIAREVPGLIFWNYKDKLASNRG